MGRNRNNRYSYTFEELKKLNLFGFPLNRLKIVDKNLNNPTINDNSINNQVESSSICEVFFLLCIF